jgi:PAT family beta-lactamase induction signal transducer AmpG
MTDAAGTKPSFQSRLGRWLGRRTLAMLLLGFASGLPFLLVFDTLSIWMRDAGVSLTVISVAGLTTLLYAFKFLWAPVVDRASVPGLTRLLGHRRAWMLAAQAVVALGLWAISAGDPGVALVPIVTLAVCTAFAGATQDVVMDAWRIEVSDDDTQGVMAAAYQYGFRAAQITAGALPLILAELYNWNLSYAVMAGLMVFGALGVLLAPREKAHAIRPIPDEGGDQPRALQLGEWAGRLAMVVAGALALGSALTGSIDLHTAALQGLGVLDEAGREAARAAWRGPNAVWYQLPAAIVGLTVIALAALPLPGKKTRPGVYLSESFITPLMIFWRANAGKAALILALICTYRLPDFVLNITGPFFTDIGFDKIAVAEARKVWGVVGTSVGVFLGAVSVAKLGLLRTLLIGSFAGPLSNLGFIWLAGQGTDFVQFVVINSIDNAASGYAGTALIAYMSSLTTIGFTAVQYAFFSSIYGLPGRLLASQSGRIVEGSATAADTGGWTAPLMGLFANMPEGSLAAGAAKSGVSPQAMAAGYTTFFVYSALVGVVAVVLTILVVRRTRAGAPQSPSAAR